MNTAERIQYEQEVGLTDGKNYEKLAKTDVNWLNEVFNKYAPLQNYEIQASGATDKLNYYVSGGYYSQDGTTADSDFNRYNFRVNLEAQAKKWLKIGTNSMLAYEKYDESVEGVYAVNTPIAAARFMLPYWNPYRPDGSIASINDGSWKGLGENPLEWSRNNPYTTKKYKAIANFFAEATIIEGLVLKVQGGVDYTHGAVKSTSTPSYLPNNGQGKAGRNSSDAFNLTVTTTLNYGFDVKDDHHLNIMLGQEGVDYRSEGFSVSTAGQSNDWLTDVSSATRATGWSSTNSSYSYVSFFGRGEYNWGQRLYADLSVRGDGSSRFGSKGRWAAFWSVGLMWNVKSENFLKDVDYADLRDYHNIYNNADNFYTPYAQNPWWVLDHNYSTFSDNRIYGNLEAGIQIIKGLKAIGRFGGDFSSSVQKTYNDIWKFNPGSYASDEGAAEELGSYSEYSYRSSQIDANVLLNADYRIKEKWTINAVAGWNINQRAAACFWLMGSFVRSSKSLRPTRPALIWCARARLECR